MSSERSAPSEVLFIASHLHPCLGIETALISLQNALNEAGVVSSIACLGGDERDRGLGSNVSIVGPPLRGWRRLDLRPAIRARKLVGSNTVVVLVGLWAALPILAVGGIRGARTIVWEHSLAREKVLTSHTLRRALPFVKFLYRRADSIVAVSEPLRQDLQRILPGVTIELIANIVEPVVSASIGDRASGRLLSVGSLTGTKNQALALRALALVEHPAAHLVLAGDGPDRILLEELAKDLGVQDKISFRGHLTKDQVWLEMLSANVLVHPALGETFGYVYYEAAEFGLPVVAVDNDVARYAIPTLIPGFVSEQSAPEFARQIDRALVTEFSSEVKKAAARRRRATVSGPTVARAWKRLLRL